MRIPASKVYRAFPELDRFPDEVCEQYMRYVLGRYGRPMRVVTRVLWAACLVLCVFISPFAAIAGNRLAYWMAKHGLPDSNAWMLGAAAIMLVAGVLLVVMVLAVRDVMLRRLLLGRILEARCPFCSYSLLGLAVDEHGGVLCPECGKRSSLADRKLTVQDVLGDALAASTRPAEASGAAQRGELGG
ncbi:MAG: hypothetical protein AMXMBFR58_13350 [Phycisphaerae bacterium]